MRPTTERTLMNILYEPSPMRAITAARCARMAIKTCVPMKISSPRMRMTKPMAAVEAIGAREASGRGVMRSIAFALLSLWLTAAPGFAQEWPDRTVRIIVPFGPGATPDMVARLLADRLQEKLGQSFVVENKPGASGNLGTDAVAKAEPDGTTIGISIGGPLAINTLLFSKLPYDPAKDIAPVTQPVSMPSALVINNDLGVNNVAGLIELLKREPGKYNFGSIGNGSLSHLAMEA